MSKSWRERANEVIVRVVKETEGQALPDRIKAIRNAYPFGERKYHPYAIWLSAVRIATAELEGRPTKKAQHHEELDGQQKLFN